MSAEITNGNVTRYCGPSKIDKKRKKPLPAAFELRKDKGEKDLSVYLLEYFGNDGEKENVKSTKEFIEQRPNPLDFKQNGGFAVLNIQSIKQRIKADIEEGGNYCNIYFKEATLPHCSGFFDGDEITIQKLLAQSAHALYFVKDL